jgi:hypothetical protein
MCTFLWENGTTTKPNDSLVAGWNYVAITHTDGCIVEDSVLIPEPVAVIDSILIENVSCFQEVNGQLSLLMDSVYAPYNISWFNGDTTMIIDSLSAGSYEVWVQDSRGCIDSLEIEISQPDTLVLQSEYSPFICADVSEGWIYINAVGGSVPYQYTINGMSLEDSLLSNLTAGSYTLTVLDSNFCSAVESIEMVELAPISATFETIPSSGEGTMDGIAIVTPSGGLPPYTYNWSSFHTDDAAVYLNSAWYSVLISDSNGCEFEDSVFVGIVGLEALQSASLEAYPNPTMGIVHLSHICDKIELYGQDGKLISIKMKSDFIDLSSLVNGLYYLSLRNEDGILRVPIVRISN